MPTALQEMLSAKGSSQEVDLEMVKLYLLSDVQAVGTGGGEGEEYFCLEGQEGEWMKKVPSMGDLPPKLRPLAHFNHLLSHTPWTLQESIKVKQIDLCYLPFPLMSWK